MKLLLLFTSVLIFGLQNQLNAQWTIKNLSESLNCSNNKIKFKNDSLGLLMGDNSTVLKSEDIGENWRAIEAGINVNFKDFQFVLDSTVLAIGDYRTSQNSISKLIRSEDLGETWDSIATFDGKQLHSLHFFNKDTGVVAGYDGIYRTTSSGADWDTVWSITEFGYRTGSITQLSFQSEIGYAIGTGINFPDSPIFEYFLLKSQDSGLSWNKIKTFQYPLTSINFINKDTGFIGTESSPSFILKTTDGENTWYESEVSNYVSVNSIHFTNSMTGFAAGAPSAFIPEGPTSFFISKSIDGGITWKTYDTVGIPLYSICFINDSIGFVSGDFNLIMKTSGKINVLPENYPWHLVGDGLFIEELEFNITQLKTYPNPVNDILNIEFSKFSKNVFIRIYNLLGELVYVKNNECGQTLQINLEELNTGLYLLIIHKNEHVNETITQHFLKH